MRRAAGSHSSWRPINSRSPNNERRKQVGRRRGISCLCDTTDRHKETLNSFQQFLGPTLKALHVYIDSSNFKGNGRTFFNFSNDTCTPYTPATNGTAERAVRRVKEGAGSLLVQSGLSDRWWHKAMRAFCFLRNVHDIQPYGKTAHELRYGEPFNEPIIAFGASVMYKPSRQKDSDEMPKMGS